MLVCLPQAVVALPIALPLIILGRLADVADRYYDVGQLISCIPFHFGEYLRYFFYKGTLKKLGRRVCFKFGSYCQYRSASLGDRVLIGAYCCLGQVDIGDDVLVGGFVNFLSGTEQHGYDDPSRTIREQAGKGRRTIRIGSDVWIGSNSTICNDIGGRSIIGVGSLVVKAVEGHAIYVGRPVSEVRKI